MSAEQVNHLALAPLPAYRIRYSNRARRLSLKFSLREGLEVIVPEQGRFSNQDIERLLTINRRWVERIGRKLDRMREEDREQQSPEPPQSIELPALEEEWKVRYRQTRISDRIDIDQSRGRTLRLTGAVGDDELLRQALRLFLRERARQVLPEMLDRLSRETKLGYRRLTVRTQKTRWGSCSTRGTISLNCKILLLTPRLARYVMLHELCHTVELNHSRRFWDLVTQYEQEVRIHEQELNLAARRLPVWFHD